MANPETDSSPRAVAGAQVEVKLKAIGGEADARRFLAENEGICGGCLHLVRVKMVRRDLPVTDLVNSRSEAGEVVIVPSKLLWCAHHLFGPALNRPPPHGLDLITDCPGFSSAEGEELPHAEADAQLAPSHSSSLPAIGDGGYAEYDPEAAYDLDALKADIEALVDRDSDGHWEEPGGPGIG